MSEERTFTAFADNGQIAAGEVRDVLAAVVTYLNGGGGGVVQVFEDGTGRAVDFDLRGELEDVLGRLELHPLFGAAARRSGPGRPRMGVVSREVTLLPRHWEWLEQQPQGISAALRRLVDEARKGDPEGERRRRLRDAAGKFMWAMAGNLPGFEEASRALYANDWPRLAELIRDWPEDIRKYIAVRLEIG